MSWTTHQQIKDKFVVISISSRKTRSGDTYWMVELAHPQGLIPAKVWNQALPDVTFRANTVAYIEGKVDEYQSQQSIVITRGYTLEDEIVDDYLPQNSTPTLVFDIETIGQDFSELDARQQDYLIHTLERNTPDPEEAKQRTALHPLFGQVSFIGCYQTHPRQGFVLGLTTDQITPTNSNYSYLGFASEKELLKKFWEIAQKSMRFITFNGHRFDFPFLTFRSVVNQVRVPFEIKTRDDNFIDLMTRIRPYGTSSYKLEMVTKALGLTNPKEEGVSGDQVSQLYQAQEFQKIADYVVRDVEATYQLYQTWKKYLAGKIII